MLALQILLLDLVCVGSVFMQQGRSMCNLIVVFEDVEESVLVECVTSEYSFLSLNGSSVGGIASWLEGWEFDKDAAEENSKLVSIYDTMFSTFFTCGTIHSSFNIGTRWSVGSNMSWSWNMF